MKRLTKWWAYYYSRGENVTYTRLWRMLIKGIFELISQIWWRNFVSRRSIT